MSKIIIGLSQLLLFLILSFLLLPGSISAAANCTFSYVPTTPDQNTGDISVTVTSPDLKPDTYIVQLVRPNRNVGQVRNINFTGTATFELQKPSTVGWLAGTYRLYFIEQSKSGGREINPEKDSACKTSFTIESISTQPSCSATIITKPVDPDTNVILQITGLAPSHPEWIGGGYDIFVNNQLKTVYSTNEGDKVNLGKFSIGVYVVSLKDRCGLAGLDCIARPARLECNQVSFSVAPRGSTEGGQIATDSANIPAKVCNPGDVGCTSAGGEFKLGCTDKGGISTAIGCIHTKPEVFVKDFMTFAIGIGGGLAFLMMLVGAFQMLTSAGNPDSLKAGQDRLTSAVIGLLFVIFATLFLQIIGFDILKIPGFGR